MIAHLTKGEVPELGLKPSPSVDSKHRPLWTQTTAPWSSGPLAIGACASRCGQGHNTKTAYERSLFTKLSLAYVFVRAQCPNPTDVQIANGLRRSDGLRAPLRRQNNAVLPLLVGMATSFAVMGHPVDQSWYESGGVVNQALALMISN